MNRSVVDKALQFLITKQVSGGGFHGEDSADLNQFTNPQSTPTIFFSALISNNLGEIAQQKPVARLIVEACNAQLLKHRSPDWSWNYLINDGNTRLYPDDLDDTACALSALSLSQPSSIDGSVLGKLANHLIANEAATGGPYRTWLISPDKQAEWSDIDLAVNANIGYLLSLHSVTVPGLMTYIANSLATNALESTFYISDVSTIYFLARWYRGSNWQVLQDLVTRYLEAGTYDNNPLFLALLITSAIKLQLHHNLISISRNKLLGLANSGHWQAAALYYEPLVAGIPHYAGSAALTTAFAIEALTANAIVPIPMDTSMSVTHHDLHPSVNSLARGIPQTDLRVAYQHLASGLLHKDTSKQISGIADLTAQARGHGLASIPPEVLRALNLASLHGWIAYTIYDDIWDGEPQSQALGVANFALRQVTDQFQAALPWAPDFQKLVRATLNEVDAANTWEARQAHAQSGNQVTNIFTVNQLPDYAHYGQLAQRSSGHMLAACGVLRATGYSINSPEQRALQRFFRHFLIARQLNDDAHDWEADLATGQLTAVACLLLKDFYGSTAHITYNLVTDLEALRLCFWQTTIDKVNKLSQNHLDAARRALAACPFMQPDVYLSWLTKLQTATHKAITQRNETQKFIAAYTNAPKTK